MKVLVTGGAGFIGSHLCTRLALLGHQVAALDIFDDFYDPRLKRRNSASLSELGIETAEIDIRDSQSLRALINRIGPEAVVHLAARAGVRPSIEQPELYTSVNLLGTSVLLEACRRSGVRRFVFGSSSSVYGELAKAPFHEDAPLLRPVSPYAATKLGGEALVHAYHHLFGMEVASLRFFTVYGPRQRPDLAINLSTQRINRGLPITLFGNGTSSRDYTFVEDICSGIVGALIAPIAFETINLAGGQTTTLRTLVALIEEALGKKAQIHWESDQPGDVPITFADLSRARHLLGYAPQTSIEEGIRRYVEWYLQEGS
jgi:UDP-glucuronate 4-epimerase